jgi:peptidoglycan LD-endopeptidase LytH
VKHLRLVCFGIVTVVGLCLVSHPLQSVGAAANCDVQAECIGRIPYYQPLVLVIPVAGCNEDAFISMWGASRDLGKRKHQGIDMLASRGTPVIAPIEGVVTRVGWNALGGRVIWIESRRTQHAFYFAHLSAIKVCVGDAVDPGDIIGTVGNTGNARFTQPHLHFGVYTLNRKLAMNREIIWQAACG